MSSVEVDGHTIGVKIAGHRIKVEFDDAARAATGARSSGRRDHLAEPRPQARSDDRDRSGVGTEPRQRRRSRTRGGGEGGVDPGLDLLGRSSRRSGGPARCRRRRASRGYGKPVPPKSRNAFDCCVVGHRRPRPALLDDPFRRRVVRPIGGDRGADPDHAEFRRDLAGILELDQLGDLGVAVRTPVGEEHQQRRPVGRAADRDRRTVELFAGDRPATPSPTAGSGDQTRRTPAALRRSSRPVASRLRRVGWSGRRRRRIRRVGVVRTRCEDGDAGGHEDQHDHGADDEEGSVPRIHEMDSSVGSSTDVSGVSRLQRRVWPGSGRT